MSSRLSFHFDSLRFSGVIALYPLDFMLSGLGYFEQQAARKFFAIGKDIFRNGGQRRAFSSWLSFPYVLPHVTIPTEISLD